MSYQRFRTNETSRGRRDDDSNSAEGLGGGGGKPLVRMRLATWDDVRRLCNERRAGAVFATVTASDLCPGDMVTVFVEMPDGLRLSLDGEIASRLTGPGERWSVELAGMTLELAGRLRAFAQPVEPDEDQLARGSREWALPDEESGNHELRSQIESLVDKMKG